MKRPGFLATAFVFTGVCLFGDTVTSSSSFSTFSGVFSSGQADPQPNVAGNPFWNNYSPDSLNAGSHDNNIGYALTNTGGFSGSPALIGVDTPAGSLLGGGGAAPGAFTFSSNGDAYTIEILFADTALPDEVTVGWYDISTPSVLNPVFSNIDNTSTPIPPGQTFTHGSSAQYGFYATVCYDPPNCTVSVTYYTDAAEDTTDQVNASTQFGTISNTTVPHFALFNLSSNAQSYVLGLSEAPNPGGPELSGDFNDLIIQLTDNGPSSPPVPEPATLGIVGGGLLALGFFRRRARA